jgi:hypothetical protein
MGSSAAIAATAAQKGSSAATAAIASTAATVALLLTSNGLHYTAATQKCLLKPDLCSPRFVW